MRIASVRISIRKNKLSFNPSGSQDYMEPYSSVPEKQDLELSLLDIRA